MAQIVNFAAILNPLATKTQRVFIWRITSPKYTLGFDQRPLTEDLSVPRGGADPAVVANTILNPSSNLVSFKYNDLVNVYGVVVTTGVITLLSPFVEPINPPVKSLYGELAGCATKDKAWIAYLTMKGTVPTISYSDVSKPAAANLDFAARDVMDKTKLSLVHDTKRLWVIHQTTNGILTAYNHNEEKTSPLDAETNNFIDGTPIASTFIAAKKLKELGVKDYTLENGLGRIIIYWVRAFNKKNVLYRCHTDLSKDAEIGLLKFSKFIPATGDSVEVHKTAQISAVVDEISGCNRVYVAKFQDDGISQLTDTWAAIKEEEE